MEDTFRVIEVDCEEAIQCLVCESISYNKNDIREKYCGRCHQYHDILKLQQK